MVNQATCFRTKYGSIWNSEQAAKEHTKQNPAVPQMEPQEKLSNVVEVK